MRKWMYAAVTSILPLTAASGALGAVVYDNTGLSGDFTPSSGASIYFDDATLAAIVPTTINQVNIGYANIASTPSTFDLLIQFYNTVNYNAAFGSPVGTNPIGSLVDITGLSLAANSIDNTGLVNLTGSLPYTTSGTVGFEFEFVKPGTTAFSEANIASGMVPIFHDGPPTTGSSSDDFAYDYLNNSTIVGDGVNGDVFAYHNPSASVYAQIGAVPEPGSISMLAFGSVALLSRRKRSSVIA